MPTTRSKGEPALTPPSTRRGAGAGAGVGAGVGAGAATETVGASEPRAITDEQLRTMVEGGGSVATGPVLAPPGTAAAAEAGAGAVTGTWRSGVTVSAMWSINETRNAWMHVAGLGWRKLFNGRDGAFMALAALAGQARQTGRQIAFREEADGMVYEIYLW